MREPSELLFSLPTPEESTPQAVAEKTQTNLRRVLSYLYDGKRDVPIAEAVVNLMRSGILASVGTFQNNLVGNTAMQITEQGAKPFMAAFDILNSLRTGKRHVAGIQPFGIAKGLWETGKSELTTRHGFLGGLWFGVSAEESARLDMNYISPEKRLGGDVDENAVNPNFIRNTGIPLIDIYIEGVKRLVAAGDRPFKTFAREAEKRNLAKISALNERRENRRKMKEQADNRAQIETNFKTLMKKYQNNPTALMREQIDRYADVVTFQNSNNLIDLYEEQKRKLSSDKALEKLVPSPVMRRRLKAPLAAAYIGASSVIPFVRTPANVGARALEYFAPVGAIKAAYHFWEVGRSTERLKWMEDTEIRRRNALKFITSERKKEDDKYKTETEALEKKLKRQFGFQMKSFENAIDRTKNRTVPAKIKAAQLETIEQQKAAYIDKWNKLFADEMGKRQTGFDVITKERKVLDDARDEVWEGEDAGADLTFSAHENRRFAEVAGRAGFGATVGGLMLLGLIYGMVEVVGSTDYDKEKEKAQAKRKSGIPDDSVKIGPYRFKYSNNPFGYALKMGVNIFEQSQREGTTWQKTKAGLAQFGEDVVGTNPLADSAFGDKPKQDWESWAGAKGASFIPRVLQEAGEVADDQPRKYFNEGFWEQFQIKIPKVRESLPVSENHMGGTEERGDLSRRALRLIDPVKTVRENSPQSELPNSAIGTKKEQL